MCVIQCVHVNATVSCVLEGETGDGLIRMYDGGFYVTVGLTRTYHLFITLDQINSISCHLFPNTIVCPFAWLVRVVSDVQSCWIISNGWDQKNSVRLRGFKPELFVQFTLTRVKWHIFFVTLDYVCHPPLLYGLQHVLCNLLRHVEKRQNKPLATSSFTHSE